MGKPIVYTGPSGSTPGFAREMTDTEVAEVAALDAARAEAPLPIADEVAALKKLADPKALSDALAEVATAKVSPVVVVEKLLAKPLKKSEKRS